MEAKAIWTDERIALLKKLWTEGLSASQIAAEIGDISRNAVIGKVHRLGLSGRAAPTRVSTAKISTAPSLPRVASVADGGDGYDKPALDTKISDALMPSPEEEELRTRTDVLHLNAHTCKWPIGDPGKNDFHFCGKRAKPGSPYCEAHIRLAYQPAERRSGKRKKRA